MQRSKRLVFISAVLAVVMCLAALGCASKDGDTSQSGDKTEPIVTDDYIAYRGKTQVAEDEKYKTKSGYDIIISAGQSNANGYGFGTTDDPYVPSESVLYYIDRDQIELGHWSNGSDFYLAPADEPTIPHGINRSNFGLIFAREYINAGYLYEGRKLLIVRAAMDASCFVENKYYPVDAAPGAPTYPDGTRYYSWAMDGDLVDRMINATKKALNEQLGDSENRVVAMLWHQGESDVLNGADKMRHRASLMWLFNKVRTEFSVPTLPIIAGDFVPEWKTSSEYVIERLDAVYQAIQESMERIKYSAFVYSTGLLSNAQGYALDSTGLPETISTDNIHFCRQSQNILGMRYFDAYKCITGRE